MKYTQTLPKARKLFKEKTGVEYVMTERDHSGIRIYKLKIMRTPTRRYFVGTYIEWLNL